MLLRVNQSLPVAGGNKLSSSNSNELAVSSYLNPRFLRLWTEPSDSAKKRLVTKMLRLNYFHFSNKKENSAEVSKVNTITEEIRTKKRLTIADKRAAQFSGAHVPESGTRGRKNVNSKGVQLIPFGSYRKTV